MARTKKGIKFNRVAAYTRIVNGKKIRIKAHDRSNPYTSRGKKRK